ncbi:MAG TPA: hypothetical protein PKD55_24095 [Bellilinea sp.]|nr:hypothetical protein [Bellilinea sp.]
MAGILSWKKAKPGTMLGGKGILIPYKPNLEVQVPAKSQQPTAESPSASIAEPSASKPLSFKERNDRYMKALTDNLNRNVLAEQAERDKSKK